MNAVTDLNSYATSTDYLQGVRDRAFKKASGMGYGWSVAGVLANQVREAVRHGSPEADAVAMFVKPKTARVFASTDPRPAA